MITIIDYGMGNLGSILNMFKRIGILAIVTKEHSKIQDAEKLLLPGVGAFDSAMERINNSGLRDLLDSKVRVDQVPILGICLGMQLLTRGSEEGSLQGFGWIKADTKRFPLQDKLKVPHMGWNIVRPVNPSGFTESLTTEESRFYFVHSYYVTVDNPKDSLLRCHYGLDFDAAVNKANVYGTQFHPEKSHKFGMRLLKNFAEL